MSTLTDWGAATGWVVSFIVSWAEGIVASWGLEEFVDLVEHLFDALADEVAFLVEGGELGLDICLGLIVGGELGAEGGYFGLQGCVLRVGCGASFAFAFNYLNGLEDFL